MKKLLMTLMAVATMVSVTGCHTFTKGLSRPLDIDSRPQGARVKDLSTGMDLGETPIYSADLSPRKPHILEFKLKGHEDKLVTVKARQDGRASVEGAGDFAALTIFPPAGAVALGVDYVTKAGRNFPTVMVELKPLNTITTGAPLPAPAAAATNAMGQQPPPQVPPPYVRPPGIRQEFVETEQIAPWYIDAPRGARQVPVYLMHRESATPMSTGVIK